MNVAEQGRRAQKAATALATASRISKDRALIAMAEGLTTRTAEILDANIADVARARAANTPDHIIDRLRLDVGRVAAMADGLRQIAALPDPVGTVVHGTTLPNGLELRQVRVPLGVVGIIFEARPNVTADAAGLCLKSGNAVLLRGSSSARQSTEAIVAVLRDAIASVALPPDAVQTVPATSHDSVKEMMRARGLIDVLIPRGGADLIRSVVEESMVPVIETGVGNCHVYVDAAADVDMALNITLNAKTQRPSVCNAAESLVVHQQIAEEFLASALPTLRDADVVVHGDPRVADIGSRYGVPVEPATDDDFAREYLSLDISVAVVDSMEQAIAHIRRFGSGHTEAIVTDSQSAARTFVAEVDAAAVMVNASTRFTDGGEFGFGAEIGISTQKLHARGPMGLAELTSTKYVVIGSGQVR